MVKTGDDDAAKYTDGHTEWSGCLADVTKADDSTKVP